MPFSAKTSIDACEATILTIRVISGICMDPPSVSIRSLIPGSVGSAS
jgi:hypothetical protein